MSAADEYFERLGSAAVARWRSRMSGGTWYVSRYMMREWLEWMRVHGGGFRGLGPDGLVEWQRANPSGYDLVDLAQEYVRGKEGRAGYQARVYGTIRSLFRHNRAAMPADPDFKLRGTRPSVVGHFEVGEYRRMLMGCNPLYRAAYLCMSMGLMGVAELLHWSSHGLADLYDQLDGRPRYLLVDLPGRKKMRNIRPYYTYIGKDALDALRVYLDARPEGETIFVTQFGTPLKYKTLARYWADHLRRTGLVKQTGEKHSRYGKNMHELRDLGRTRWQMSGAEGAVAEFIMGHTVDPLGYNKAMQSREYVLGEYRKAEPWLNVLSEDPEKVPRAEVDEEMQTIRDELYDIKKQLEVYRKAVDIQERYRKKDMVP